MSVKNDDLFYGSEQFQAFFKKSKQSLILKSDLPRFTILAVSDNYLDITHKQRIEVLNKGLFEVYPGSHADPSERDSVFSSFARVIKARTEDILPVFKYEIQVAETGNPETFYWSNLNEPIFDARGSVAYLINTTSNITAQVLAEQALIDAEVQKEALAREQVLNAELAIANEELRAINEELQESQQNLALLNSELEERVASRTKALSESEEMMRAAITSARLGTWFMNSISREFIPSARMKELFGYHPNEVMSFDAAVKQISEEYREKVVRAVEAAVQKGENFDLEYSLNGYHDGKLRWIRATGKLYQAKPEKPQHFSGTIMDITESKLDDIRKNDFIAMVSHELKTPLTSLHAYIQVLTTKTTQAEDPFIRLALEKVNSQVKKMTIMINSFLNVSRLESGKIQLDKSSFNLNSLIRERVEEIGLTNQSHTIYFHPCKSVIVFADEEKIGQVINNLLSNAVKYSPNGKQIDVSCSQLNNMIQVRVKDKGVGVFPQDAGKIFERFYRVKSNQTQTVSGFGIGLYLCSEIIQRHQGMIAVESDPGQGSTFYFTLPLA